MFTGRLCVHSHSMITRRLSGLPMVKENGLVVNHYPKTACIYIYVWHRNTPSSVNYPVLCIVLHIKLVGRLRSCALEFRIRKVFFFHFFYRFVVLIFLTELLCRLTTVVHFRIVYREQYTPSNVRNLLRQNRIRNKHPCYTMRRLIRSHYIAHYIAVTFIAITTLRRVRSNAEFTFR